jgi:TM2 domain-containing membrane protein YozV
VQYYIADGTAQRGPYSEQELAGQGLRADMLVWREGMPQWLPAGTIPELQPFLAPVTIGYVTPPGAMPGYAAYPPPSNISNNRLAAGLCGIFIGTFGIHKFVLGLTGGAVTMLCVSLGSIVLGFFTCGMTWLIPPVMHIIGMIEGIIYLTKTDADFYQTYMVQKRQWF